MNNKKCIRILILIWVILALGLYLVNGGWNRLTSPIYRAKTNMTTEQLQELFDGKLVDVGYGSLIYQYEDSSGTKIQITPNTDSSRPGKWIILIRQQLPLIPPILSLIILLAVGGVECGVYFLLRKRFPRWAPENTPQ
ncbi:MAG: hypothetical protein PUB93_08385 [Firmicutes bacterium]|nr:hypothetical protein [Bacillota bacterium]